MHTDKANEECGVLGLWNQNSFDTADMLYLGLYGIQHRGQQSAGMCINDNGRFMYHKELGLVSEIFDEIVVKHLSGGKAGIAHVGYFTSGDLYRENTQPLVLRYIKGQMAVSYNGSLLNAPQLRKEFEDRGYIFQSNSDCEVIAALLSSERVKHHTIEDAIIHAMERIEGTYSFLVLTPHKLIAVRDPYGMKPLCIGKLEDSYVFASESCALDTIGASLVRDVSPGEVVVVSDDGIKSKHLKTLKPSTMCIFEFVYMARTDSFIDNSSVYQSRYETGRVLAKECHVDADMVIGVPDSGLAAALGYSYESGIPYAEGLIKNRYIGRTFIQPRQALRETSVALKLNALRSQIEGKRVILMDDSIVRGTTSKKVVQMLKENGGAKEVHMLICSPPIVYPCLYGVDTADKDQLIANQMPVSSIKDAIGADSVHFISLEGLLKTPVGAKCNFCSACFNGKYPIVSSQTSDEGRNQSER